MNGLGPQRYTAAAESLDLPALLIVADEALGRVLAVALRGSLRGWDCMCFRIPGSHEADKVAESVIGHIRSNTGAYVLVTLAEAGGKDGVLRMPGLEVLERILAEIPLRRAPIVVSSCDDPVGRSAGSRLKGIDGRTLLKHAGLLVRRLPVSIGELAALIRSAASIETANPMIAAEIRDALRARGEAAIRHRHRNLRAALRMLDGAAALGATSSDELLGALEVLRAHNPGIRADIDRIAAGAGRRPEHSVEILTVRKARVLLVDDEADLCAWGAILAPLCRRCGAELTWCSTLLQAESRLEGLASFDVVLLDMHFLNEQPPPDPVEVLSRVRAANAFIPIVVFTTEREGRYVRDISKGTFSYFFKEIDDASRADTEAYARAFCKVLDGALKSALPHLLRGVLRLLTPVNGEVSAAIRPVTELLEQAGAAIEHPAIALPLTVAALMQLRIITGELTGRSGWHDLQKALQRGGLRGLRLDLPLVVRGMRNYASHYETPPEPKPTGIDAVVFLLATAVFVADLASVLDSNPPAHLDVNARTQISAAVARIGAYSGWGSAPILDEELRNAFCRMEGANGDDFRRLLVERCERATAAGRAPFWSPVTNGSAYLRAMGAWFGDDARYPRVPDWSAARDASGPILYLCQFLMLERASAISASRWSELTMVSPARPPAPA